MTRFVPLLLAAVITAFPTMPSPRTCAMQMSAMPMHHPCCAATTRAPAKRAVIRVQLWSAPARPPLSLSMAAARPPRSETLVRGSYWQPLATIQLRI